MVKLAAVTQANARFANSNPQNGLVCVFAGATSGIGAGTIERMAVMVQEATFYVLGRSASRFVDQRAKLENLNPKLKLVFLQAEVSLLSDIDAACKDIIAAETKVDILYMSQGCFPINVPQYSKEGLDLCLVIQYYSRMRLTTNLLGLLHNSPHPRILSVLSGGREQKLCEKDIGLEDPRNYSWSVAVNQITTLTTLSFEYLASTNPRIIFLHSYPGLVRTEIFLRRKPSEQSGWLARILTMIMSRVLFTAQWYLGISVLDSGAKQAFILTSEAFGPGELWRIDENCEPVTDAGVLERYRKLGWPERVWEYTVGVIEKALATVG